MRGFGAPSWMRAFFVLFKLVVVGCSVGCCKYVCVGLCTYTMGPMGRDSCLQIIASLCRASTPISPANSRLTTADATQRAATNAPSKCLGRPIRYHRSLGISSEKPANEVKCELDTAVCVSRTTRTECVELGVYLELSTRETATIAAVGILIGGLFGSCSFDPICSIVQRKQVKFYSNLGHMCWTITHLVVA